MIKIFKTENGTTIEVRVTEPKRINVTGEIMEIPKGTKMVMVAENTIKGIRYEYVNTEELNKADFEGERRTDNQKELQEFILTEGFPHQEEVGNFWFGVPDVSDDKEEFSSEELVGWAEMFDKENGSEMGNIHQYALYLASRIKAEGWEAVADKADKRYKRHRIVKDHRAKSGLSYVGGCSFRHDEIPASYIVPIDYSKVKDRHIIAWIVLSKKH